MANEPTHNDQFEELCAGYVLHALDEDEREQFEQMLDEATDQQRRLYRDLWATANQLAFTMELAEPSDLLKDRILAEIRSESSDQNNRTEESSSSDDSSGLNWPAFAAAASFALLVVSLSLLFYSFNLSSEIENKEQTITQQQTRITQLKNELQRKEEMLAILESREVDMILMSGLKVNPDGYGKVIWDSEKQQALLQVSNLPPVPKNKDYQLWIIKNNKPVSAGVFAVNDPNDNFFKIEEMAPADEQATSAFAITLEPKGGVPQPTGDMYLLGNMNSTKE